MQLFAFCFSVIVVSAAPVLAGGGIVTSTGPLPEPLSETTAADVISTIGLSPASFKVASEEIMPVSYQAPPRKVTYTAPPRAAAKPAPVKTAQAKTRVETGPPDPRETIRQCVTCHGVDGIAKIPTAPNIAGSSRGYLETQLKAFRSGKRENEVMSVIAEGLSNAEIKAAAKWYAALKVTVDVPE